MSTRQKIRRSGRSKLRRFLLGTLALAFAVSVSIAEGKTSVQFTVTNFTGGSATQWFTQGGIPFPQGAVEPNASFHVLRAAKIDDPVIFSVKITGYWPDGSVKWVLVRMQIPVAPHRKEIFVLEAGPISEIIETTSQPWAWQDDTRIHIDTGKIRFVINRKKPGLFERLERIGPKDSNCVLSGPGSSGLFVEVQKRNNDDQKQIRYEANQGTGQFHAKLEEVDPICAVIKLKGVHATESGNTFAPYTLRLYAYKDSARVRLVHFFVYDGKPKQDFVADLGVRLKLNAGQTQGYTFGTDRGTGIHTRYVDNGIHPRWQVGYLEQDSAQHCAICKSTNPETSSLLRVYDGGRSQGWAVLKTQKLHLAVGVHNFWQEYPKAITVNAEATTLTAHFYSPYSDVLDLRRYSDLTYPALYETPAGPPQSPAIPFRSDIYGARYIGKSSELMLDFALPSATDSDVAKEMLLYQRPPLLRAGIDWMAQTEAFGKYATINNSAYPQIVQNIADIAQFFVTEQEYRNWYSFMDYGDVVLGYNATRDQWCFDEGGYGWSNNEGQACGALWRGYLMTGNERLYRLAEAMTQHVQDVDTRHDGPFVGKGSRHNVNHWGCICHQFRMTIPFNKRVHYFLSGDETTRDRINFTYETMLRKEGGFEAMDFGVGATATLFMWETTGDKKFGEALKNMTETFCSKPVGEYEFPEKFRLDFRTGLGSVSDAVQPLRWWFLMYFGPMDILLDSYPLTKSSQVKARILNWAKLLLMDPEIARKKQISFPLDKFIGMIINSRVAVFAYEHTGDKRYLDYARKSVESMQVSFETIGSDGVLSVKPHTVMRIYANAPRSSQNLKTSHILTIVKKLPLVLPVLQEYSAINKPPKTSGDAQQKVGVKDNFPVFYEDLKERLDFPMSWLSQDHNDFKAWRKKARAKYIELLMTAPPVAPFNPVIIEEEDRGSYVAQKIVLSITADSRVLAYMLIPKGKGSFPAVLLLHDHGAKFDIGKEKVIKPFNEKLKEQSAAEWVKACYGNRYIGDELAKRGYVCFSTDVLNWSDRGGGGFDGQEKIASNLLYMGMSFAGLIAHEDLRAAEFLSTRDFVDDNKVAAMGLSMGSFRTWQIAALTDRIKAGVAVCWMSTLKGRMIPGHNQTKGSSAYTMNHPGISNYFDFPDLASIACPKPMAFYNGFQDPLFPVSVVKEAYERMRKVWQSQGVNEKLVTKMWDAKHVFDQNMQDEAFDWLDKIFKNNR